MRTGTEWRGALAATVVLTVFWTAPWLPYLQGGMPDSSSSTNAGAGADARLVVWALAWEAHALVTHPLQIFDANIFHPARGMLTGSDTFVSVALLAAPVYWITGNAVLAANLVTLASYGLCFLLGYVLLRRTGSPLVPSALGGIAMALGPFRVPADVHALQFPIWVLPLVLLACLRAEESSERRGWLVAALAVLFGLFVSFYMAAMVMMVLAVEAVLVLARAGLRPAARLASATLPGLVLLAAFAWPWMARSGDAGTEAQDSLATFESVAALYQPAYLDPANPYVGVGWTVALLAAIGLLEPILRRERPTTGWWRWLLLVLAGMALAIGPSVPLGSGSVPMPYGLLLDTPLRALRAFPRFFLVAHLGVVGFAAAGAGLALERIDARFGRTPWAVAAAGLLLAVLVPRSVALWQTEFVRLPVGERAPDVYRVLAEGEPGPLLEVPGPWSMMALQRKLVQAEFMVQSTNHWRPLLNGHTGYPPWWWRWLRSEIYLVPESRSALQALVDATHVKWILVHREHVGATEWERWRRGVAEQDALVPVAETDDHLLVRVEAEPRRPWRARLEEGIAPPGETILGTSFAPLPPKSVAGEVELVEGTERVAPGSPLSLHLLVRNRGAVPWPALAPTPPVPGVVVLEARWIGETGEETDSEIVPLMRDVFPGETQHQWVDLHAPAAAGRHTLAFSLRQVGHAPLPGVAPLEIPISVSAAPATR